MNPYRQSEIFLDLNHELIVANSTSAPRRRLATGWIAFAISKAHGAIGRSDGLLQLGGERAAGLVLIAYLVDEIGHVSVHISKSAKVTAWTSLAAFIWFNAIFSPIGSPESVWTVRTMQYRYFYVSRACDICLWCYSCSLYGNAMMCRTYVEDFEEVIVYVAPTARRCSSDKRQTHGIIKQPAGIICFCARQLPEFPFPVGLLETDNGLQQVLWHQLYFFWEHGIPADAYPCFMLLTSVGHFMSA